MLHWGFITIFPEVIEPYTNFGIFKRAQEKGIFSVEFVNLRQFTNDVHKTVDDKPFGGGAGMVMMAEPVYKAVEYLKNKWSSLDSIVTVLFDPRGKLVTQEFLEAFMEKRVKGKNIGIIAIVPRYEGIDERITHIVDYVISVGPYVLSGAELASLVFFDALTRLVPGVLGNLESLGWESMYFIKRGRLYIKPDFPHYTRPRTVRLGSKTYKVPSVLTTGDHKKILEWRKGFSVPKKVQFLTAEDA